MVRPKPEIKKREAKKARQQHQSYSDAEADSREEEKSTIQVQPDPQMLGEASSKEQGTLEEVMSPNVSESSYENEEKLQDLVKCNSEGFNLTFSELKSRDAMKTGLLSKYEPEAIKRILKTQRQKIKREAK